MGMRERASVGMRDIGFGESCDSLKKIILLQRFHVISL